MTRNTRFSLVFLALPAMCCGEAEPASPSIPENLALQLVSVASGLTAPVYLTAPAGDSRLFIVEQPGRIRVVRNGQLLSTPFLDIASKVRYGGEQGLLSVAFDPLYSTNGRFYVYYSDVSTGAITIERYHANPPADVADAGGTLVISIDHSKYSNHNGGLALFGPDGMLYIGTGDGGSGGDPDRNGQNTNALLGKLLRLDVRSLPYTIPSTNPFVGQTGRRGEIWAYGLRNPWRFAFNSRASTPQIYIADVGQGAWEEISVAPASLAGVNYGWNTMEGTHCYGSSSCNTASLRQPVLEYDHSSGNCSITGGFVYRGSAIPELADHYFFSDYCSGWLASASVTSSGTYTRHDWPVTNVGSITSFGEDAAGEQYMLSSRGTVYRIAKVP